MVDVTGLPAAVGDTVILFGDRPERLRALAERAGTIDYEPLCLITGRVPRIFVGN
jgi:alanine racemase